jgi:hypothetical protein
MGKKETIQGVWRRIPIPGHFLMDAYPGFELDGWII